MNTSKDLPSLEIEYTLAKENLEKLIALGLDTDDDYDQLQWLYLEISRLNGIKRQGRVRASLSLILHQGDTPDAVPPDNVLVTVYVTMQKNPCFGK